MRIRARHILCVVAKLTTALVRCWTTWIAVQIVVVRLYMIKALRFHAPMFSNCR